MISIIVPIYNEEKTILAVLDSLKQAFKNDDYEIIVVDNGSIDHTKYLCMRTDGILYIRLPKNYGKGYAVRIGFTHASGEYLTVQDGDLEYDPKTLKNLVDQTNEHTVIYGKRDGKQGYILNRFGNKLLSSICNMLYKSNLTDIYTCYKVIPRDIYRSLELTSDGFEIEAEITAKLLRTGVLIKEIPITYSPRTFKEGKKIHAPDALIGIWTLVRNKRKN